MDRRTFIGVIAGGLLAALLAAEAQQATKVYRIGVVWTTSPECPLVRPLLDEFR